MKISLYMPRIFTYRILNIKVLDQFTIIIPLPYVCSSGLLWYGATVWGVPQWSTFWLVAEHVTQAYWIVLAVNINFQIDSVVLYQIQVAIV